MFTIEEISVNNLKQVALIKDFLSQFNLEYDHDIDYTIAVYDANQLVGTASKHKNILKCFAVLESYQGCGVVNTLVKQIEDRMFREKLYHFFIYTKACQLEKFKSIGYQEIITDCGVSILENGKTNIKSYLQHLKHNVQISDEPKACIVMNANPFTLGHRYLIEQASKENKEVIVFVVSEEKSTFPFSVRVDLVQKGTSDLKNVTVLETGPYLISNLTFPTYFIKNKSEGLGIQATLDCKIFLTYYQPLFNISVRYIGEETICQVTNAYNQVMLGLLPQNDVEVKLIKRCTYKQKVISASFVRECIVNQKIELIRELVPEVTFQYITTHVDEIREKLKEGKRH